MPIPVELAPPAVRRRGMLTSLASRIQPEAYVGQDGAVRWPMEGLTWNPAMFTLPEAEEATCATVYNKQPGSMLGPVEQPPFLLWRSLQCNALSGVRDLLRERIDYSLDDLVSAALAAELETGAASGGLGLIGNSEYAPDLLSPTGAVDITQAFLLFEEFLAEKLNGAVGVIHLSAAAYVLAESEGLIDSESRTATGHLVIGDAGHTGAVAPVGGATPGDNESYGYATSTVWYDLTPAERMESSYDGGSQFDFTRNVDRPMSERSAIVLFDPEHFAAVLINTAKDNEGGGGGGGGGGGDGLAVARTNLGSNKTVPASALLGYSIVNDDSGASAVQFSDASGRLANISLAVDESVTYMFPHPVPCDSIVYAVTAGEVFGTLYYVAP